MRLADIRLELRDGVVHATLNGDIDLSNAATLRDQITDLTPNHAVGLVLDLSAVTYLDSAGIHLIHRLREDLRARGQRLALVIPAGSIINDTLRLAGLRWEEEIAASVADAERMLQRS